jgi:ABC-type multidrug transport system fused ATPase/permease subunit
MSHCNTYYPSFSAAVSRGKKFLTLRATSGLLLAVFTVVSVITVISLPISGASAQLLSDERRNSTTETGSRINDSSSDNGLLSMLLNPGANRQRINDSSSDNGLLSMLLNPGANRQNLSSIADTMFKGVEERIDARLNPIKSKLDEIAAVALPLAILSGLGIVILASLIVAFILISWYDRFKIARRSRRDFRSMSENVVAELKDNIELLRQRSSTKPGSKENLAEINDKTRYILNEELTAAAMKASIISPYFWNLSSSAQNATLKLESLVDKYNRVFRRVKELEDHIILNKVDKQTADNMLKGYEETLERYAREIINLSQQLTELIQTQTHKGIMPTLQRGQKESK